MYYLNFHLSLLTMKLPAVMFFALQRTEFVEDSSKIVEFSLPELQRS